MNPYAQLLDAFGGPPDSYLVIDTETNGMSVKDELTLPTQLGYLLVVDRKVEDCGAVIVNWAKILPAGLRATFWDKVRKTEWNMITRGIACKVTEGRIAAEGEHPHEAWSAYHELLSSALENGFPIVGFNIYAFDCPLLERVGLQMETPLVFEAHRLRDYGLFEKAHSAVLELPDPTTRTIGQWYSYVKSACAKGKWSLANHCIEKYALSADGALAHGADYDCWIVHQLCEAYRALAEERCLTSSPGSSIPSRSTS